MPNPVPNEVYAHTHDGLAAMISARAASRMLDAALARQGLSPDSVDADSMGDLLKGPVFHGLQQILPREGLKQRLNALIGSLSAVGDGPEDGSPVTPEVALEAAPAAQEDPPVAGPVGGHPDVRSRAQAGAASPESGIPSAGSRSDAAQGAVESAVQSAGERSAESAAVAAPPVRRNVYPKAQPSPAAGAALAPSEASPEILFGSADGGSTPATPSPVIPLSATPALELPAKASSLRERPRGLPLSRERLETMALSFAQLEHVVFVAAFEEGEAVFSRGTGYDVRSLKTLGLMGMKLLEKSGEVRSYYLAHDRGQLFIFPLGPNTLMVVGQPELSLGVVLSTLAALKEDV